MGDIVHLYRLVDETPSDFEEELQESRERKNFIRHLIGVITCMALLAVVYVIKF